MPIDRVRDGERMYLDGHLDSSADLYKIEFTGILHVSISFSNILALVQVN